MQRNMKAIARLEKHFLKRRTISDNIGSAITNHIGHIWVVVAHAVWFTIWIGINSSSLFKPFDPYPYTFLTLVVSLEAIFLTFFVLMGQNVEARQSERRAHLDLQINLLAEQEMTKALQMLIALCERNQLEEFAKDKAMQEMIIKTRVEKIASDLEKQLDKNGLG